MEGSRIARRLVLAGVIAGVAVIGVAAAADAQVDVTGTYHGTAKCKGFFAGEPFNTPFEGDLALTRSGDDIAAEFFGVRFLGKIIDSNANPKKAEGALTACGTAAEPFPDYGEMLHAKFTVNSATKANLTGQSVFVSSSGGANATVASCKYTFKRIPGPVPAVPLSCPTPP